MAAQRRAFRFVAIPAGGVLCLTIAMGVFLLLRRPDFDHSVSRTNFSDWASAQLDQAMNALQWLIEPNRVRLADEGKTGDQNAPSAPIDPAAALGYDISGLREALPFYKIGDLTNGDTQASLATDPIVRTTLEWAALRDARDVGYARLQAFVDAHPEWPARDFIQRRIEEALYWNHSSAQLVENVFTRSPPETLLGRLALARAWDNEGKTAELLPLVREIWRNSDLNSGLEARVKSEFGSYLDTSDHKARADRLLYEEENEAGLRAAALAGKDVLTLAKLRAAVNNEAASAKMFAAVPAPLRSDPAYLFAKIQKLRQADKIKEAAALMLTAPRDPALVVDGDAWWQERRTLARKILDLDDPATAYRLCAENSAEGNEAKIDAEFQAGWIALRFLNDPTRAATHFDIAARFAATRVSIARIAYWQGRAAEISQRDDADSIAKSYYEKAATWVSTYYGQLARERLGLNAISLRGLTGAATGKERDQSVKVIELLYALGENDLALGLAIEAAQHMTSEPQLAALANVVGAQRDAHASLVVGKILGQRQIAVDSLAFPTYGIPSFEPAENSAAPAIVYAIARQESAFDTRAVSSAGAKGLMQMIVATARNTAKRVGMEFDENRLLNDVAFNAKLGAAHLGELFAEQRGSPILAFAAYNAGGGRVKQWIEAYGDPRSPGVDPVDWVERIPFAETRNYVQRVMENWAMYQASFRQTKTAKIEAPTNEAPLRTAARL